MKKNQEDASPYIPSTHSYKALKEASQSCHGCHLYKDATQTVFGKGPRNAVLMLVGEQPGNSEDLAGLPFVGPSGNLLHKALEKASIDLGDVYVTNAVKHFKFVRMGKRRLHQKPDAGEVRACRPWLEAEIDLLKPRVIVALGATAARSLLGADVRVRRDRGQVLQSDWAGSVIVTEHPSAILRAPDEASRELGYKNLVRDLKVARKAIEAGIKSPRNLFSVPEKGTGGAAVGKRRRPHDHVHPLGD